MPEHLMRHPTREAIESLACRFKLPPLSVHDQDWEFLVADRARVGEFLTAYESGELTEDERFVLMQTIVQSCEDLGDELEESAVWKRVLTLIERDIEIHISSVWYWTHLGISEDLSLASPVAPWMRQILARHRSLLESPG